jgi:molecular chaperone IbpA
MNPSFRPIVHSFLGFDNLFDQLESAMIAAADRTAQSSNFPPYNVYKVGDGYIIEVAVAGYKREDIEIKHDKKKSLLIITGDNGIKQTAPPVQDDNAVLNAPGAEVTTPTAPTREVIRTGIARRSFTRSFNLADDLEVSSAGLQDGMLTVTLMKVENEADKPLLITIG